jgi:dolichol-phosphate mannosyltransferase
MQALPFFFLSGMLMTPDAPLTAAWAAALYFLERALLGGDRRGWVSAGVCVGVGLLSKYTIGLLVPAALVFCLWDPSSRAWLRRWQPYAACLLALALFSPVILWNAEHHWMSFAFQTARRLAEKPQFGLPRLILSAFVLLTPVGFLTLAVAAFGRDRVSPDGPGVFIAFSLRHDVKIDWTGALWVAVMPALAQTIICFGQSGSTPLRRFAHACWIPTVLLLLLAYGVALQYLVFGLPHVGYSRHVELVPVAWRDLGRQISAAAGELRASSGTEPVVVGMDRYVLASELAFYARDGRHSVRDTAGRHLFDLDALMYELWFPPRSLQGRTLLLVGWAPEQLADSLVGPHVARLDPIHEGTLERHGFIVSHYYYRAAYGFH